MKGELYINGKDAYETWGMSLSDTSLSALLTPPPNKDYIESKSRLEHGKSVILDNVKVDERDVTLQVHFTAKSEAQFFDRYSSFCEELKGGKLELRTSYQPTVIYRFIYVSCQQFSQFMRGIAKFSLRLNEPNPENRAIE